MSYAVNPWWSPVALVFLVADSATFIDSIVTGSGFYGRLSLLSIFIST